MNRYAEQQLLEWKNSPMRKPLLIMGARQVGKTWLMHEFGRKHYKEVAFVSFDSNENMRLAFSGGYDVQRLLLLIQAAGNIVVPLMILRNFRTLDPAAREAASR